MIQKSFAILCQDRIDPQSLVRGLLYLIFLLTCFVEGIMSGIPARGQYAASLHEATPATQGTVG